VTALLGATTRLESIVEDLKSLLPDKLEEAADFIRRLNAFGACQIVTITRPDFVGCSTNSCALATNVLGSRLDFPSHHCQELSGTGHQKTKRPAK
jgi:hypothetical protein